MSTIRISRNVSSIPKGASFTSDDVINGICTKLNGTKVADYKQLPKKVKYDTFRNKVTTYTLNHGLTLTTNGDASKFTVAGNQAQVVLDSHTSEVISYKRIDDIAGRETDIYIDGASMLDLDIDRTMYSYFGQKFVNRIDVIGNLTISQYGYNVGRTMSLSISDRVRFAVPYTPFFDSSNDYTAGIIERLKKVVVGFAEDATVEIRIHINRKERFLYVYLRDQLVIKGIRESDQLGALLFTVIRSASETTTTEQFRELVEIVHDVVDNIRGDRPQTITFV